MNEEFLNHISSRGGWPTAGMTWQIKNKEANECKKTKAHPPAGR